MVFGSNAFFWYPADYGFDRHFAVRHSCWLDRRAADWNVFALLVDGRDSVPRR